jgi:hypothetical protein
LALWKKKGELDTALSDHRRDSAGMFNMEMLEKVPPPSGEGAAAALRRLQGLESIFYSRMLDALTKGRSDLISFALTDYRKITESLRMYEREVEQAMRDSGQLISRGEAERGVAAVARWFRLGWRLWLSSSIPDLLQFADNARAFKAEAEKTFAEIMKTVFARAREAKLEVIDRRYPKMFLVPIRWAKNISISIRAQHFKAVGDSIGRRGLPISCRHLSIPSFGAAPGDVRRKAPKRRRR